MAIRSFSWFTKKNVGTGQVWEPSIFYSHFHFLESFAFSSEVYITTAISLLHCKIQMWFWLDLSLFAAT